MAISLCKEAFVTSFHPSTTTSKILIPSRAKPEEAGEKRFDIDFANIYFSRRQDNDRVYLRGNLELDLSNGDGVDITEDVTVNMGPLTETITMVEKQGKATKWKYRRPRDGAGIIKYMTINWQNGKFSLYIDKANLDELTNPVTVSILIGDDHGDESISMKEWKHRWIYHFAMSG